MCFSIMYAIGDEPKPIIADHDIKCYKVATLRDNILAAPSMHIPYLNVKYHNSVTMTAKITPDISTFTKSLNFMYIEEGLHAFTEPLRAKNIRRHDGEPLVVAHCIIPKGTLYYEDCGVIVAEKMIIYNPFPIEK